MRLCKCTFQKCQQTTVQHENKTERKIGRHAFQRFFVVENRGEKKKVLIDDVYVTSSSVNRSIDICGLLIPNQSVCTFMCSRWQRKISAVGKVFAKDSHFHITLWHSASSSKHMWSERECFARSRPQLGIPSSRFYFCAIKGELTCENVSAFHMLCDAKLRLYCRLIMLHTSRLSLYDLNSGFSWRLLSRNNSIDAIICPPADLSLMFFDIKSEIYVGWELSNQDASDGY